MTKPFSLLLVLALVSAPAAAPAFCGFSPKSTSSLNGLHGAGAMIVGSFFGLSWWRHRNR